MDEISKMKLFEEIANGFHVLTIFVKSSVLCAWKDSKHVSVFRVLNLDFNVHVPVEKKHFSCSSFHSYPNFFLPSL